MKLRQYILVAVIGAAVLAADYRVEHACNFQRYFHALAGSDGLNPVERALFSFILTRSHRAS